MISRRAGGGCVVLTIALSAYFASLSAWGMSDLSDSQMSSVDGEGVAIVLENIRATMAPTSYIESVGSPDSDPSVTASNGASLFGGANYQFLGLSFTGVGGGEGFGGTGCSTSGLSGDLGCALGAASIPYLAAYDNPLMLRVHSYNDFNTPTTVIELSGPTNMSPFRMSYWAQIAEMNSVPNGLLQGQVIMEGKLASYESSPLAGGTSSSNPMAGFGIQMFQTPGDGTANANTLGLTMTVAFSGDMRISLNQAAGSPNALNKVPTFDTQEGMIIKNLYVYLPIGELNSQSLVFNSAPSNNGNWEVELTPISTIQAYGLVSGDSTGYATAQAARSGGLQSTGYYKSHGYVDMGLYNPGCTATAQCGVAPTSGSTTDGIYFATGNNLQDTVTAAANTEVGFNSSSNYNGQNCGDTWCVEYSNYTYKTGGGQVNTQVVYNGASNTTVTTNPSGSGYNSGVLNLGSAHMDGILINHLSFVTLGAGH